MIEKKLGDLRMRSRAEIGKGCEEDGYQKGTKGYDECIERIRKYEELSERDIERKQKEEADEKLRNRRG